MSRDGSSQPQGAPTPDPWAAVSYLISGVGIYGGAGWLLDRWLGTTFFVMLGLLLGAALGVYVVYVRFGRV